MTDLMAAMLTQKGAQLAAGASTAWVPSADSGDIARDALPPRRRARTPARVLDGRTRTRPRLLDDPPRDRNAFRGGVAAELDDNVQSILGYVVRWIDQGIGCSKVPDLSDVALMEDRATLRISSQLLGNWLAHGLMIATDVDASLDRIAPRVDAQNATDPDYRSLGSSTRARVPGSARTHPGAAARPNGYTEPSSTPTGAKATS